MNSATGAFVNSVTDISLPGIGLPFAFTRTYNSADTFDGPLRVGWTHSYAVSLTAFPNGDISFKGEDGQRSKFILQPDGSYKGGVGVRSTLKKVGTDYRLTRTDQVVYTFDSSGVLTQLADRNNNRLMFSYTRSRLTTITDTVNRAITLTYNSADRITKVTLPDGRFVAFTYSAGLLATATDLRGKTTQYFYDSSKRLTKIVDPLQHTVVENTYGSDGRVTQQRDALQNLSTFYWDATTETSTMTDARGNQWKDVYSGNVLIRRIDPLGNVTRFDRDDDLNLTSVTDPRNNSVSMTYDNRGNLLTWTAPAPFFYEVKYTYNSRNDLMSVKNGRGFSTTYDYDSAGNLTKVTQPGSVVTQFGRDTSGNGLLRSITDPRLKITAFDYDSSGNLTKVTTPLESKTTMGYDASGRMTSMVEPRGNLQGADPLQYQWNFAYDAADSLRTRTDPLGNVTEWTYDDAGNLATMKDAKNRVTQYGYNAADELTSVTASDPTIVTTYGYDQVGNLTSRTDDNLHTTTYGYDAANRLQSVTSPLGQLWTYEYDPAGNMKKVVTAIGNSTPDPADGTIGYGFDALNRMTSVDYSDATPDVQFAYDPNGNRTSMSDGAGTETSTYDDLDQLKTLTRGPDVFSYDYDPAGNVTRRTYPDGTVIDYTYDDDGRLGTLTADGATTTYGYDAAANLTSTALPSGNGFVETKTYDRAGRLTEVKNTKGQSVLSSFVYTLDEVGNPTKVVTPTETTTYTYDLLDRLTEACFALSCLGAQDPYIRWTYDGVGNRLTETRPSGTTTYSYNAGDQLTSTTGPSGTTTYSYDTNGNETQAGGRTFTWDLANRLASTQLGSTTTTYSYDGDGKRLREASDRVTNYLWDANFSLPQLALERNDAGSVLRRYVHGTDLLSLRTGGSTYYYHYDDLGSVANLTSSTGAAQWTYSYEPFGGLRSETKHATSAPRNQMRFTGEYFDTSTALYHLRARQYDTGLGRMLSLDPMPSPITQTHTSSYCYVANRPTLLVDPSGLRGEISWLEDLVQNPVEVWLTGWEEMCLGDSGPSQALRLFSLVDWKGVVVGATNYSARGLLVWYGQVGKTHRFPIRASAFARGALKAISVAGYSATLVRLGCKFTYGWNIP